MKEQGPWTWFVMLLQLVFIILRLCGVITWSWWWVMAPLIATASLVVLLFLILGLVAFIAASAK